jgi:hypothetical protein
MRLGIFGMLACAAACAHAAEPKTDAEAIAYKLTTALYHTTNTPTAWDVNLRGTLGDHQAWVGYYKRDAEFEQLRAGYSPTLSIPWGRITPSFEVASHGYLGGSVTAELGDQHFLLLGFGRTNLKDYFNLTFDPNDMFMIGAGTRVLPKTTLSVYQVKDNRLHTGQRVLHVVARTKPDERTRWTLDIFYREGRPSADDETKFYGTGVSVTYDFEPYFVRVGYDPHVNFTPNDMVRVAAGVRF